MLEVRERYCCFPREVLGVNVGLACVDGIIAILAFSQLIRIHSRNSQLGWTRQKVFHLLIASSNTGYFVFFLTTIITICKRWQCWSHSCGFIFMALPKILSFAAFLLLLSFWVDLHHQADDEDCEEEDFSFHEALLEMRLDDPTSAHADSQRICLPFRSIRVGSRQKIVIWVTALVFILTIAFAVLMWIGMGNDFIDSPSLATAYVDVFAIALLLLGGALACYGLLICAKMRRVRSERAASEMWKVAGLAVVSVICFTSSAFVALFTQIPILYHCQKLDYNGLVTSLLLILYYFIGSSVPSAFILWIMRELPPAIVPDVHEESRTIAYITDTSVVAHIPQRWTTATSLQNQISRGSPI
ncbi:tobamovirus multiplication protein 1 isoform X2 [Hevea brasiliensis]|uniref:tobamovirus multiplication protein 1 isoform X2 n=1 Tax=Hevea brasiliensis TaxID=3981 RepID=UPI0025EF30DC|nr:tobamovirus multiplication protein 1 isoform X2 [Hevea brasiliensis]